MGEYLEEGYLPRRKEPCVTGLKVTLLCPGSQCSVVCTRVAPVPVEYAFEAAARCVVHHQTCSSSLLQRKLLLGYHRTQRVLEQLTQAGIIAPPDPGSRNWAVRVPDAERLAAILHTLP